MLRNLAKHSKPVEFPIKRIPCPLRVTWAVPTHYGYHIDSSINILGLAHDLLGKGRRVTNRKGRLDIGSA
jgi:hypothetical protein